MKNIKDCFRGMYAATPMYIACLLVLSLCAAVGISYLFYDTLAAAPAIGLPVAVVALDMLRQCCRRNRIRAAQEFVTLLEQISAGLYAGISLENSYHRAVEAVREQYGSASLLSGVLKSGQAKLSMNVAMVDVLWDLADETQLEDVMHFARVAAVAHRGGGNLIQVITQSVAHIRDKLRTDQEISAMISAKKMEQEIMCCMPFAMFAYMKLTSPGYFDVLYHCPFGVAFMSVCLLVIFAAYLLGRHFVRIEV